MNCLPSPFQKHCSRRPICRPCYLLSPFSWHFLHSRLTKFYYNHHQYTLKGPSTRTNTFIHLSSYNHRCSFTTLSPSTSRSHHNTPNRPEPQYGLLRPSWWRRPHPLSTFILVFRTPRSLYSNSPRVWCHFSCSHSLFI